MGLSEGRSPLGSCGVPPAFQPDAQRSRVSKHLEAAPRAASVELTEGLCVHFLRNDFFSSSAGGSDGITLPKV